MQTSSLAMSWHRKLHQAPASSPVYQIHALSAVPSYSLQYYGSPPEPGAEPPTTEPSISPPAPPPEAPTAPLARPPSTGPSNYSQYDDGPPAPPAVGLIVGIVIGGLILLLVAVGIFVILYRRRNRRRPDEGATTSDPNLTPSTGPTPIPSTSYPIGHSPSIFTYEELAKATNGFSENNLRGEGGFGRVHEGVLPSGKVVAVKQLKLDSKQGEREFRAEVEVISHVHHKHLVSLVGYCISGEQRLLVYEFVPNGNLEYNLRGFEL